MGLNKVASYIYDPFRQLPNDSQEFSDLTEGQECFIFSR